MYDSVNKLLEQQQKFTNWFNQVYIPELTRMQQTYSEIIKKVTPSVTVALQNLSEVSSLVGKSLQSIETDKVMFVMNRAMEINKQITQSMNSMLEKVDVDRLTSLIGQITLPVEALQKFSYSLSLMESESFISNLSDVIQNIPDYVYETLEDEDGYSKEEIQEELEVMKMDELLINIEGLTPSQVEEKVWSVLWKKYPKVAYMFFVISMIFRTMGVINPVVDFCLPIAQDAIVRIQGNEDSFFIKTDSAKLYIEPDSHSKVITRILYAEEVTQIDSVKMWDKVIYVDPDGEEMTGWIAKRNLMPYKDYQFNSDDLYDMESEVVFEPEEEEKTEEIKECDCSATNARVEGVSAGNIANYTLVR